MYRNIIQRIVPEKQLVLTIRSEYYVNDVLNNGIIY